MTDGTAIGSGASSVSSFGGDWVFGGCDIDGEGASLPVNIVFDDIDISNKSKLLFKVKIAEDDDGSNEDWDVSDYVRFYYDIDNSGTWSNLLFVENDGTTANAAPGIDTDFDGDNDGTLVTDTFVLFEKFISGTGSTIDLKIEWKLSSGDEDMYIDDLSLYDGVSISGSSGFRLMSSPVAGTVYDDILGDLWIQGMTNGDVTNGTANVWTFDVSGQSWSALSNLNTASQTAGEGFLVYVFADTDFDGDDDLPVTLSVSGTVNSSSATVPSSGSIADGEYALAGNPYAQTIDWDDVTKTNMSSTVYVYDDAKSGGAGWIDWNGSAGDLSNGLIAPYQGFIIKGSGGSGTITIETADQASSSGTFYKTAQTYSATFTVTSETSSQNFYFSFNQDGNVGMDSHDAHKLMPLDITPRLVGMTFADGNSLGTNNLPLNLTGSTEIDVDVMSLDVTDGVFETVGEDVTLSWDLSAAPAGLSFMLTNTQTQETVDLSLTDAYTFTTQEKGSVVSDGSGVSSYPLVGTPLLKLTISALSQNVDENPMPSAFALHPAYPNPFNPSTTITFDVPDYIAQPTLLQIYDISGSLVQTLVNGVVDPGTHSVSWGPKNLSSGIYIVELRAGDNTFNHKISYIK